MRQRNIHLALKPTLSLATAVCLFKMQVLGTEVEEGVVYSVSLKRVRYRTQPSDGGHLQWNSHKIRTLKAGTVDKLVEYLAPWKDPLDVSYRTCFLSTYRTFATPDTVLQLLLRRYKICC